MKLYICGNGFDLHHGLRTSYLDYKKYLKNNHPDIIREFEDIVKLSDDRVVSWSGIEESLGIDYTNMLLRFAESESTYRNFESYNDPNNINAGNNLEDAFKGLTSFITNFTGKFLLDWIRSIDIGNAVPDLRLTNADVYLCFNYTDTLHSVYGINRENILHIHGALHNLGYIDNHVEDVRREQISYWAQEVEDKEAVEYWEMIEGPSYYSLLIRNELKFGAVINKEEEMEKLRHQYSGYDELNDYVQPSINVIEEFIDKSIKSISENYDILSDFLAGKDIDTVVIMGHSLLSVDYPYYQDIILPLLRDKRWIFKSYNGDMNEIEEFVNRAGITDYTVENW